MEEEKKIVDTRKKRVNLGNELFAYPTFGCFPKDKWKEYEEDARVNHSNSFWVKAWTDHVMAKQSIKEDALWSVVLDLKKELEMMKYKLGEAEKTPVKEEVKFIGTQKKVKKNE